jgi:formate-dependent nitrite reductase membrane component NrfD
MSPGGPDGAVPPEQAPGEAHHGQAFGVEVRSYHGQPVIKEPIWTWEIPLYFYTGGLAGASAGLGLLAGLRDNQVLARRAWAAALAGVSLSPALLTSDLGKPARFINMLRLFKVTSPMSVGSWILTFSGGATTLAAAHSWLGLFPRLGRLGKAAAAILGLPLSTYTGALVANTAVPAWHEARRELPFVFGAGAAMSAGAVAVMITPTDRARPARRLALVGAALEGTLMELMVHRLGEHGEVYKKQTAGQLSNLSRAGIVSGGLLLARRGRSSRAAAFLGGALLSAAAVATRWAVFRAGFQSAADPSYVVGSQRARVRAGRDRGAARTTPRVARADPAQGSPAVTVEG